MTMLTIHLPSEIEIRLQAAADLVGKTTESCVREAVLEYLQDVEDYQIARQRMHDIQTGKTIPISHQDVMREHEMDA